jgi:ABC-type transporter Mla subunit MlaD
LANQAPRKSRAAADQFEQQRHDLIAAIQQAKRLIADSQAVLARIERQQVAVREPASVSRRERDRRPSG